MSNENDIRQQQELLQAHRERLAERLKQQAICGIAAEPHIAIDIRKAREAIAGIKATLRKWGVAADDHPDDEESPNTTVPGFRYVKILLVMLFVFVVVLPVAFMVSYVMGQEVVYTLFDGLLRLSDQTKF